MPTHVLVVEDHALYRETFCALLQSCFAPLQITAAADGLEALRLTQHLAFDLLILDYQLETLSGGDVVRHLRARTRPLDQPVPPIILMSSHPDIAIFARSLGVTGFLAKPVSATDLQALVGPVLLARRGQVARAKQPR